MKIINTTYKLSGMSCTSCAQSIESYLKTTKGVNEVNVNYANDSLLIEYDSDEIKEEEIFSIIRDLGYDVLKENLDTPITFLVEGMSCASCANTIEETLKKIDGITEINLNIVNDKLSLKYDKQKIKASQIQKEIDSVGYKLIIQEEKTNAIDIETKNSIIAKKKVIISSIIAGLMMILMLVNMFLWTVPGYLYIVALMGFPVIFIIGKNVHIKSLKSLKIKKPNMDVLVSLGSVPPYLVGLMGLFFPITTFIEMATMIMTLHLIGKYLETKAKGKASQAIKKLLEIGAKKARVLLNGNEVEVLVEELSINDIMLIKPGEKIPMDGVITEGESTIDESLATGESLPVKRKVGDNVIGATVNKNGYIKVKVTKIGDETFLAQIIKMVEACQGSKVPIQEYADRITGIFVPAILGLTLLTFISFNVFSSFHLSILNVFDNIFPWINTTQSTLSLAFVTATAVLVIACPCALGLGTPTALMVGSGKGAENGILIRNGEAVQTLKDIKAIAFDKTGTLTIGKPQVTKILANDKEKALKIAASLEVKSEHVLAQAIINKAKELNIKLEDVKNFSAISGMGIKGIIDKDEYLVGNIRLFNDNPQIEENIKDIERLEEEANTVIIIGTTKEILGIIAIADEIKPEAKDVILTLEKMDIKTIMITGDNEKTAKAIAKKANISNVVAQVLPEGKVETIKKLQDEYGLVAMVGDGINDAPSLKQANVGISLGSGTDIAIESSDVTIVSGNLISVVKALVLSREIFKKIKQNYFWAWFYNALAIPFAALGLLHPMIGALAMSLSSLNVIYNSLRLKKIDLKKPLEVNYETR
ncbi:MAG: heavy metal translocating P-type ATPase [Candidatus Izemoplasmatales bacterium]|jgi:Cu+-exporting ATPase|nr:heavy metal translocating P-type ATPase [Candidatus Izemoplasmatales bacterium]